MKIRFRQSITARVTFRAGDELSVGTITPDLQRLLNAARLDGSAVCEVVREGGPAYHDPAADDELAVTNRSRRRTG